MGKSLECISSAIKCMDKVLNTYHAYSQQVLTKSNGRMLVDQGDSIL